MAQILKEEIRNKIVEAAKEEFLEKGYKDASLRSIAQKAGITVGNLYRYFRNKEDINLQIVGPTLDLLEAMLSEMTDNKVSFEAHVFSIRMDTNELIGSLDRLADEMVEIYRGHKIEFNILMMHSKLNDEITDWFANICKTVILQNYPVSIPEADVEKLAHSYASSIFAGMRDLFGNENRELDKLKFYIKIYFRSYVYMLDTDIRKYLGELS
ncbi:MAG: TetR/AcrR family transcriptional regulator [Erysipelotrichaceae bacterium]|nr:TetR/AcrR family transcriptional regulator [Erysipelotrichaceae bacterium]